MEKTGPEGVAAGSRRLYWNRTGGWTGGREGDSVADAGTCGGEAGVGERRDGADSGETGEERDDTETGSAEVGSGNRKDRETEGAGGDSLTVEEGEA